MSSEVRYCLAARIAPDIRQIAPTDVVASLDRKSTESVGDATWREVIRAGRAAQSSWSTPLLRVLPPSSCRNLSEHLHLLRAHNSWLSVSILSRATTFRRFCGRRTVAAIDQATAANLPSAPGFSQSRRL